MDPGSSGKFAPLTPRREVHLAIVSPMANEAPTAERLVREVLGECAGFRKVSYFVVLDNHSRDATRDILENYAIHDPRLTVVWAPENRCVVDAYLRGYQAALDAGADWILEIDGGFSHQPADVPQFFEKFETGKYDCLFGSRFVPGGRVSESSLRRYLISYGGSFLSNLLLGMRLKDMTSGFELFSRRTLAAVLETGVQSRGPFFQTEIKFHCRRLRLAEVPIHYKFASHHIGGASLSDAWKNLLRLRRERKRPGLEG